MEQHFQPAGISSESAEQLGSRLQGRLVALIDLSLVLKHIHWNVVGPNFIAVHEMLDDQVEPVREMSDEIAERIAILGFEPVGTPGYVVKDRTWDDYPINRGSVPEHLKALDSVYDGIIADHRTAAATAAELDPVTEDLLVGQTGKLEMFQWFVRSHTESTS